MLEAVINYGEYVDRETNTSDINSYKFLANSRVCSFGCFICRNVDYSDIRSPNGVDRGISTDFVREIGVG